MRYALETGNVNNHHITCLLPAHKNYKSPEAEVCVKRKVCSVILKNTVKNVLPDVAENDTAYKVRNKENSSEYI